MSSVHLIAGDQVAERYEPGGLVAVCGEVVDTATCSPDDDLLRGVRRRGARLESAG